MFKLLPRRNSGILIVLFLCVTISIIVADEFIHKRYLISSYVTKEVHQLIPTQKNIIFPRNYDSFLSSKVELLHHYNSFYNELKDEASLLDVNVFQYQGGTWLHDDLINSEFKNHKLSLYEKKGESCKDNKINMDLQITDYKEFDGDLTDMVKTIQYQLEHDDAFKELKPYFNDDLATQIKTGTMDKHWYKFAGSSVWLESLGVHLMISRVIYSSVGSKRKPIMSLAYAQIFDEYWTELKDIELILPIRNEVDDSEYVNMKFPNFLPIPFYHDPKFQTKVYYGPEDTRLFLVRNEKGEEEPMVIFNSYHRKIVKNDVVNEKEMKVSFEFYRSMFLSWPFRTQRGKINVDGLSNKNTDNLKYCRVVELRREGIPRVSVQKNWTPMISFDDRKEHGYDKYMYFVYRWSKLEILKCNLDNFIEGTSPCLFEYQRKIDLSKDDVGPLRGGTELINVRQIIKDLPSEFDEKEMWIGFPRAHIKDCGCGKDMYRPNLAVITREADRRYKITQLSSYTSLDIEVYGWTNPNILCASRDPNALISNGISGWQYQDGVDYLTLSLSVADATNHIIHIKNLMNTLLQVSSILKTDASVGFNDDIIDCALKESGDFCKKYGEEMKKLDKTPPPEPDY